jgi:hypothetical protein
MKKHGNRNFQNSCNGKGCDIRHIVLPTDGSVKPIRMEVRRKRDDIQKVLSVPYLSLDKVA